MEKEYDFSRLKKRMPYKTPANFLDEIENNVWKEIGQEAPKSPKHKPARIRFLFGAIGVAACISMLFVLNVLPHKENKSDDFRQVEQAFANLSIEDQNYIINVYQEDLFINE